MTGGGTRPAWVRAFSTTFALRVVGAGAAFTTTLLIARYRGKAVLAQLAILLAVVDVVAGLAGPALDATLVRFASRRIKPDHDGSIPYFQRMFRVKLIVAGALVCLGVVAARPVLVWILREPEGGGITTAAVALAFAGGAAMTLVGFVQSYYQAHQRFGRYASIEFANTWLRLCAVGALLFVSKPAALALLAAYVLSPVLVAAVGSAGLPREIIALRSRAAVSLREPFRFAKWVIAAAIFTTLAQRLDLFLLKHDGLSDEMIGPYAAALAIVRLGDLAIMTLFSVLLPRASQVRSGAEVKAFLRRFHWPALVVLLAGIPLAPLAGPAVRLCFGDDFAQAGGILAILLFGSLATLCGAPAGAAIYGMGRSHLIALLEGFKLVLIFCGGPVGRAALRIGWDGVDGSGGSRYNSLGHLRLRARSRFAL